MNIWRLTISPSSKEGIDPRRFCIDNNILGVGWGVDTDDDGTLDWDTYVQLGRERYYPKDNGWWPAVNAIGNRMEVNDLCWTRDYDGQYYLGRIDGPWRYTVTPEHRAADIVNVRTCLWKYVGTVGYVPGKVVNSFRAGRTVQAVHSDTVLFYSKLKYSQLSREAINNLDAQHQGLDFFDLIDPDDCEDIVAVYLQNEFGYRLLPSTCKSDTPKTEFVLRKRGCMALVQVKQGYVDLNRDDFPVDRDEPCEWFLFTTHGQYLGKQARHIRCLDPAKLRAFAWKNLHLMSGRVREYINLCNRAKSGG